MHDTRSFFAAHRLRCTQQRLLVYETLKASNQHPTADELLQAIRNVHPGLSLATVYNTLEALVRAGLCRRLPSLSPSGPCRFDAETHEHAHVILSDGRVADVPDDLSARLIEALPQETLARLEAQMGVSITNVSVQIYAKPSPKLEMHPTSAEGFESA